MGDSDAGPIPREGPRRTARGESPDLDAWLRCGCALVVAGVAAYASYVHQREFALQGGADEVSASLWPLSVDGLLLLATVGLLKPSGGGRRRARSVVWLAFVPGIVVSLAANIAAAPSLAWKPVLVAGCRVAVVGGIAGAPSCRTVARHSRPGGWGRRRREE
ncbi:DUF2637 domain-containing protein [Streptomyces sp. NPDC050704]|uniref:DUF2637 domain-containing protein n=1 Tax=Streptomyces sp. NPDC050704 TaxID=3157219 RepID=UPI00343CA7D2